MFTRRMTDAIKTIAGSVMVATAYGIPYYYEYKKRGMFTHVPLES
jgi:hypothetical protein